MRKLLVALGAAAIGSAVLAGGDAMADGRYGKDRPVLATGLTFCPAGNQAVFPATNVGKRAARVTVSCLDGEGAEFPVFGGGDGPIKTTIPPGGAAIVAQPCVSVIGELNGELVRCTVSGRNLEGIRGVLHICEIEEGPGFDGCDLTEALIFGTGDEDDD